MLSYRHAFHAGNFADILKHTVLSQVLLYLNNKEKGYSYIDTHAGAGMYQITDASAQKTGEYLEGIAKIWQRQDLPESLEPLVEYVSGLNANGELELYPGSPSIASHFIRRQDAAFLYDLHPKDHQLLSDLFARKRKVQVFKADGYHSLKAHLPPATKRALVLMDPPYELKTDYHDAVAAIINGYKLFSSGTFILWYPVVQRHYVEQMEKQLCDSSVRNVLQLEYQREPDNEEFGMTGTGLFIVNPPWTLAAQAQTMLPYLLQVLGSSDSGYRVEQLINE